MLFSNQQTIKKWVIFLCLTLFSYSLYSQSGKAELPCETVYSKEFEDVKTNSYNKFLLSISDKKPSKNWDDYNGGNIKTTDSLFYFEKQSLSLSFPSNTNITKNDYLIFYF